MGYHALREELHAYYRHEADHRAKNFCETCTRVMDERA